jgi:hypothetical protein
VAEVVVLVEQPQQQVQPKLAQVEQVLKFHGFQLPLEQRWG